MPATAILAPDVRFRDQELTLEHGQPGRNLDIDSASPLNYFQAISEPGKMPETRVDGKLFLPRDSAADVPLPVVIMAPGSLGVGEVHLQHAATFLEMGTAAFVLDSFGPRSVTSTVANQTQFSFAASAYDVLASCKALAALPEIDANRIGAQGHSRGGTAVLTAATRRFADTVVGEGAALCAVLAAYPWCGHQFLDPRVGDTAVHVLMGDADEWCSPMQAQAHCQAIRLTGGRATMRLIKGAQHSFDRDSPIVNVPNGKVSPAAPIAYIADDGAFLHPLQDTPDRELVDRDLMVYALKAGFGKTGARMGSTEGQPELFRTEMTAFWRAAFNLES
jgi:dienelactone hydrolase